MKTVTISVRQEHIDGAIQFDCETCPVALAVKDVLSGRFWIGYLGIHDAEDVCDNHTISMPEFVGDRIRKFDSQGEMEPFEFEVNIPECLQYSVICSESDPKSKNDPILI